MIALKKPSAAAIDAFLASQARHNFTYAAIGATATTPPAGYNVDHTRIKLGRGERTFLAAKSALQKWAQFKLGWCDANCSAEIKVGSTVAILGRFAGLWWLNACRIVYVIDEQTPIARYGFGYGTLPSHAGTGEERFLIEWNPADDTVWYEILAFSKPRSLSARLGYRWLRKLQRRFARDSAAAMLAAVASA